LCTSVDKKQAMQGLLHLPILKFQKIFWRTFMKWQSHLSLKTVHKTMLYSALVFVNLQSQSDAHPTPSAAASAPTLPLCAPWSAGKIYLNGDYVTANNTNWRAKWWTQNNAPGSSDVWEARPTGECTPDTSGDPGGGTLKGVPTLKEAQADEVTKTSSPLFQQVKASVRTLDTASVEAVLPGRAANPINVKRVERILGSNDWQTLFAMRNDSYTYTRFLQAIAKFPAVCDDYTDGRNADAICRKGLATMFAHFAQETGAHDNTAAIPQWRQGLYFLREMGCSETGAGCLYNSECDPNTWQGQTWACGKQADGTWKKYF
jgi:chitodextrinase